VANIVVMKQLLLNNTSYTTHEHLSNVTDSVVEKSAAVG
jgi:hypothetical protein